MGSCVILAIIVAPFFWTACYLFRLFFIVTGWVMVPFALMNEAYYTERNSYEGNNGDPVYIFSWKIMAPWQNYSDGFYCKTYFDYGFFWTSVWWSCYRNPTGGLRWLKYYNIKIDPMRLKYVGSYNKYAINLYKNKNEPHWWYCWQGLYSGLMIQFKLFKKLYRLWIGHKLDPRDVLGLDITDYRREGAAFTSRIKSV